MSRQLEHGPASERPKERGSLIPPTPEQLAEAREHARSALIPHLARLLFLELSAQEAEEGPAGKTKESSAEETKEEWP